MREKVDIGECSWDLLPEPFVDNVELIEEGGHGDCDGGVAEDIHFGVKSQAKLVLPFLELVLVERVPESSNGESFFGSGSMDAKAFDADGLDMTLTIHCDVAAANFDYQVLRFQQENFHGAWGETGKGNRKGGWKKHH